MRTLDAHPRAHRRAPDRLGQRAAAGALHAAVQPDGALRRRPAAPGVRAERRAGSSSTGRTSRRSCRSTCGRTCGTGWTATATSGHAWMGLPERKPELVASLIAEIARARPVDVARPRRRPAARRRSTGAGTGRRPSRRWSTSSSAGELAVAGRNSQFERLYDLPERVLPAEVLAAPDADAGEATASWSAGPRSSHGVATAQCLRDYYRLRAVGRGRMAQARRRAGRGRRAAAGADRGLEPAGLPAPRRRAAAQGAGAGPAQPVRPGRLGARAHREAVRLPLPDRDLRARGEARARLLRAAVPARRPDRRPGRPQGRPQGRRAAVLGA